MPETPVCTCVNDHHDRGHLPIFQCPQGGDEFEANTAGTNQAEYRRGSEVVLPPVNRHVSQLGNNLGKDAVDDHLGRLRPNGARGFNGGRAGTFDGLGEEFGYHADRVQAQRQHTGERAKANRCHEHDPHDQIGNRSKDIEDRPGQVIKHRVRSCVAGRGKSDGQRQGYG